MISAFGAILLIAAGGYAGFSALEHLRTALRSAETILDASRDMRTEILCHRTPLPQLLERLGARYPRLFPDAENASMLVREFSFLSVWMANIRCAALPKPLEEPLLRLGAQLCSGTEPDDQSVTEAAQLAAWFSQARDGQNIPVDVTAVKNVKKPAGAKPGMVVYYTYRTVYVTPDAALAQALKAR